MCGCHKNKHMQMHPMNMWIAFVYINIFMFMYMSCKCVPFLFLLCVFFLIACLLLLLYLFLCVLALYSCLFCFIRRKAWHKQNLAYLCFCSVVVGVFGCRCKSTFTNNTVGNPSFELYVALLLFVDVVALCFVINILIVITSRPLT